MNLPSSRAPWAVLAAALTAILPTSDAAAREGANIMVIWPTRQASSCTYESTESGTFAYCDGLGSYEVWTPHASPGCVERTLVQHPLGDGSYGSIQDWLDQHACPDGPTAREE